MEGISPEPGSVLDTATRLGQLITGERAWFWFAPSPRSGAPLRLRPLQEDPSGQRLLQEAAGAAPLDVSPVIGFVQPDEAGILHFVSAQGSERVLQGIAALAHREVAQHPAMARLRGATMTQVSGAVALGRIADDTLWEGLPAAPAADPYAPLAAQLDALRPGDQRFFWLTLDGPGGQPRMLLGDPQRDRDGAGFARAVQALRRSCAPDARAVFGAARVLSSGRLCFTTDTPKGRLHLAMARLIRSSAALSVLAHAVLVDPDGSSTFSPEPLDQALVAATLPTARVFWLTSAAVHGQAQLALAEDPQALKRLVEPVRGSGQSWRGALSSKDGLRLRVTEDAPAAQAALEAFLARTRLSALPTITIAPSET